MKDLERKNIANVFDLLQPGAPVKIKTLSF